jgi:hypothetical protein
MTMQSRLLGLHAYLRMYAIMIRSNFYVLDENDCVYMLTHPDRLCASGHSGCQLLRETFQREPDGINYKNHPMWFMK